MKTNEKMLSAALIALKTADIRASKNEDFINLYTNRGKELEKLKTSFSKDSAEDISIVEKVSNLIDNMSALKLDIVGLEKDVISGMRIELKNINQQLESFDILPSTSARDIIPILNRKGIQVRSFNDFKSYREYEVVELLLEKTKLEREIQQFEILGDVSFKDGIKTKYHLWGSLSGRVISYSPCLQNLPAYYKEYILPLEESHNVYELDIVSAEVIALAFLSEESKVFEILAEGRDVYEYIAENVFNRKGNISKEVRKLIKIVTNGILLGMGGRSIAEEMNSHSIVKRKMKPEHGEQFKVRILGLFPAIKQYQEEIKSTDKLITALGHQFQVKPSYKNLSFPAQNLIATLLKFSIRDLDNQGLWKYVINVVHDSIYISCPESVMIEIKQVFKETFMQIIPEEFKDIEIVRVNEIGGK